MSDAEPLIERWNEADDGPLTERGMRSKLEAQGYHVSRYVYPPGTRFPAHTHAVEKKDAVLSGQFRIVLEGREALLGPGDAVLIPVGAMHTADVVGDEAVVSLDAVRVR